MAPSKPDECIDLSDWDGPLARYEPLPGQRGLFEVVPSQPAQGPGQGELFDTGRDLPGAEEKSQRIIWDVGR